MVFESMKTKFSFCFLFLILFAGCATTPPVSETDIQQEPVVIDPAPFLRMQWANNVSFNAYMDPADAIKKEGSAPTYLYGDGGAGGVLAQLLIHSAISSSKQKSQYTALQKQANTALTEYQSQLSTFSNSDLWDGVKSKDIGFKTFQEGDESGVTIYEAEPEFVLSPDQRSLMLINKVEVFKSDDLETSIYTNSFVVISKPINTDNINAHWNNESSNGLIHAGASIFADSMELAKKDFNKEYGAPGKQKTFRYKLGKKRMYEHGQLIAENCSNVVMKNLRGYIYKLPIASSAENCESHTN